MGGGLVQLAAYGAQDVYLTTNPQITYFKAVYKRYTNDNIHTREDFVDECLLDEELVPMIHENNNYNVTNKEVYTFLKLMYKILKTFELDIKDSVEKLVALDTY